MKLQNIWDQELLLSTLLNIHRRSANANAWDASSYREALAYNAKADKCIVMLKRIETGKEPDRMISRREFDKLFV
jgi:hypothetical protein